MAASIYATPPPDLSSEDTALSDVSNTSSTTNNATVAVTATSSIAAVSSTSSSSSSSSSSANPASTQQPHQYQHHHYHSSKPSAMTNTCESKSTPSPKLSTTKSKRTIADVFKDKATSATHHNSSSSFARGGSSTHAASSTAADDASAAAEHTNSNSAAMAAVAAAANAAMQLQLLEALNDAAKKRRKQNNPTRMEEDENKRNEDDDDEHTDHLHGVRAIKREQVSPGRSSSGNNPAVDYEDKLSKMFLPKSMEHLKETFELLQQQQQQNHIENISKSHKSNEADSHHRQQQHDDMVEQHQRQQQEEQLRRQAEEEAYNSNPYQTFCKECGENFENEFKLSLHMLQEHNESHRGSDQNAGEMSPMDILASVKVKLERPDCGSPLSGHNSNQDNANEQHSAHMSAASKEQQQLWLAQHQMPPMGFPFPPEAAAAAALQAGGYLPLLAVPGFPGVDGLNRPPLRIFNPEAFCELCNKEFCNKYFLKTHKANKHGIYDPVGDTAGSATQQTNTMNAMNQMFQLQMQQQQQHLQQQHQMKIELAAQQQQQQHQQPHPKMSSDNPRKDRDDKSSGHHQQGPSPVYCDICSKRFTNIFAMRRHRAKAHDQTANATNSQRNSPNTSQNSSDANANAAADQQATKQFQMPDGFRQDFALEQEDVSFTPQPRKLSAQSQQQARDANFAHDKLKRLGVINPDAFCELCCKEYCNKYFLRTHKWKRHGIFMPAEDTDNFQKMPNWPFMNMPGMPVNLMMAQHMMATAENNNSNEVDPHQQQPSKRIKFEAPDADEEVLVKESANDENQENRSENNQNLSIPTTPEPQKLHADAQTVGSSAEAAMGLQNLQKLQSMIQQLNDLNGKRPVPCHLCGREMENQYALQAHIMAEHSGGMEGMPPLNFNSQLMLQQQQQQTLLKQSPNGSPGSLMPIMGGMGGIGGELRCTPCEREFSNLPEFQKHITEVHLLPNTSKGSPLREGFVTPERKVNASMVAATRPPYTITPTSSYCEICNKELCNKYFMKTHMQRMHGIEIENGAQIGGVVCNICNKELCSKYFLRVHKHNTHGIIEEGSPLPQPRANGLKLETETPQPPPPPQPQPTTVTVAEPENLNRNLNVSPFGSGGGGVGVGVSDVKADSTTYSTYTESCPICSRRFRSPKWLRSHLLHDHGPSGVEKMRELEQQYGSQSKPNSPTLKIPNGSSSAGGTASNNVPSPAQLAQALQNLNAQQLLQNMPKNQMSAASTYNSEPNVPSPQLKEYQCSQCSFTTPYYAFLFIHERTHSIMNGEEQHHGSDDKPKDSELDDDEEQRMPTADMDVDVEMHKESHSRQIMEESHDMDRHDYNEMNQPTNLSMRTPSPRPVSIKEEVMAQNSPSPLLDLSRENSISADKDNTMISNETPKHFQSAACSPIFSMQQHQMLQDMAEQFGKTASYAVPRERATNDSPPPQMQAFAIDTEQTDECNRFVPAIIYLPVKERITGSMKLSFNLTPV